jgi:hypothetical protein
LITTVRYPILSVDRLPTPLIFRYPLPLSFQRRRNALYILYMLCGYSTPSLEDKIFRGIFQSFFCNALSRALIKCLYCMVPASLVFLYQGGLYFSFLHNVCVRPPGTRTSTSPPQMFASLSFRQDFRENVRENKSQWMLCLTRRWKSQRVKIHRLGYRFLNPCSRVWFSFWNHKPWAKVSIFLVC